MIQKGTILVAKDECLMDDNTYKALIIGKEYDVHTLHNDMESSVKNSLVIKSEIDEEHYFSLDENDTAYWGKYFDLKKDLCDGCSVQ